MIKVGIEKEMKVPKRKNQIKKQNKLQKERENMIFKFK